MATVLIAALILGTSIDTFLRACSGAIGGVIGRYQAEQPYIPPPTEDVGAWRDARWRAALKRHLGAAHSPKDTILITDELFKMRSEALVYLPQGQRDLQIAALRKEKAETAVDDLQWAQWYDHYHFIVVSQADERDLGKRLLRAFIFNLEAAATVILIAAFVVPTVRRWWCFLLAGFWFAVMMLEVYGAFKKSGNKWSSLTDQIRYLSETAPVVAD